MKDLAFDSKRVEIKLVGSVDLSPLDYTFIM
jgi:hypothetical protein